VQQEVMPISYIYKLIVLIVYQKAFLLQPCCQCMECTGSYSSVDFRTLQTFKRYWKYFWFTCKYCYRLLLYCSL